jgi:hypothetical protein
MLWWCINTPWFLLCIIVIDSPEKEDDVEDVDNVDIGDEMNKQVPLEDLSPTKAKLNYD